MNITYLLGAGASANCLPTYFNFKRRFESFINLLKYSKGGVYPIAQEIIIAGEAILKEFDIHNTPDTIAKKYFHQGDLKQLDSLKKVTILFFIFEQSIQNIYSQDTLVKSQTEKRYDSFLAGILQPIKSRLDIHSRFNILTWNYDIQFEIIFSNYCRKNVLEVQNTIQSIPFLANKYSRAFNEDSFSIVHLNGIAYPKDLPEEILIDKYYNERQYPYEKLFAYYKYMQDNPENSVANFSFAWENFQDGELMKDFPSLSYSKKIAQKTDVLVIVGYSFPIFNRLIDKEVFTEMKNLEKVYVQTEQFEKIGSILQNDFLKQLGFKVNRQIVDVGFTDQFFIPPEWDSEKPKRPNFSNILP